MYLIDTSLLWGLFHTPRMVRFQGSKQLTRWLSEAPVYKNSWWGGLPLELKKNYVAENAFWGFLVPFHDTVDYVGVYSNYTENKSLLSSRWASKQTCVRLSDLGLKL